MQPFSLFVESKDSHVILAYGRMNPPGRGHQQVINKVHELAKKYKAPHHVVLSSVVGGSKNPLPPPLKLKHVKRMFPDTNITLSTKEYPGIIQQAERIQGNHKHLHVVAGSDRVPEYHELLHRYNGKNYNYQTITVHSAGERKPLLSGVPGSSGTKQREFARTNDYQSFSKGLPDHISDAHKKQLFDDVRKYQPKIIKESRAIFLTGGPGSGKDIVLRTLIQANEIREINTTQLYNIPLIEQNLVINGSWDEEGVTQAKLYLEENGYQTVLVYVHTSNEESKRRNEARQITGRVINENVRESKWIHSSNMQPYYETEFGNCFYLLNNETVASLSKEFPSLMEKLQEFLDSGKIINTVSDINKDFNKLILHELFDKSYPITPDDEFQDYKDPTKEKQIQWPKGKAVKKKKLGDFRTTPTGTRATGGGRETTYSGVGRDYETRGGTDGVYPMGGIGDPGFREGLDEPLLPPLSIAADNNVTNTSSGNVGKAVIDTMSGFVKKNKPPKIKTYRDFKSGIVPRFDRQ